MSESRNSIEKVEMAIMQSKVVRSERPDIVAEKYLLRTDLPVEKFDNKFCKAYKVDNLKNPDEKLYGLVYESGLDIRMNSINLLKSLEIPNLYQPLAAEIVFITGLNSNEFVLILQEPKGVTLRNYVKNHYPLNLRFIIDQIIQPITKTLNILAENSITYGKLNPDQIFVDERDNIMLSECVSELVGFSQMPCYETVERLCVNEFGKGCHDNSIDYFALGILISFIYLNKDPLLTGAEEDEILKERIEKGSYNILIGKQNIPLILKEVIRGLTCDKKADRWNGRHMMDWFSGKVYKPNMIEEAAASQHLQFNQEAYYNMRILAHDMFVNWDSAKRFLMKDKVVKWIDKSLNRQEIAEVIAFILRSNIKAQAMQKGIADASLSKILAIMDPKAPVRFKEVAANVGGIKSLITHAVFSADKDMKKNIAEIISNAVWKDITKETELYRYDEIGEILENLEKSKMFVDKPGIGFGIERALYATNPNLPCQSPIVKQYYVTDVKSLLICLDKEAADHHNIEVDIMDAHIGCYIADRMNINDSIRVNSLKAYPHYYNDPTIKAIALLSIAQKHTKPGRLANVSKLCVEKLEKVISNLKNNSIREDIIMQLHEVARDGMLVEIYKIVTNPSYIKNDQEGFERASKLYSKLQMQKSSLSNNKKIMEIGYRYGLRASVVLAYLICSITFVYLVAQYI